MTQPKRIRALSDQEIAFIQGLLNEAHLRNRTSRSTAELSDQKDHQEILAPETYFAKTPSGGIPGLNSGDSGTGTASSHQGPDVPGQATCDIYRLIYNIATGNKELILTGIHKPPVFNLSSSAVPGDTYVGVTRDKYGDWFVITGAGSGLPESGSASSSGQRTRVKVITCVQIVAAGSGTGTGTGEITTGSGPGEL